MEAKMYKFAKQDGKLANQIVELIRRKNDKSPFNFILVATLTVLDLGSINQKVRFIDLLIKTIDEFKSDPTLKEELPPSFFADAEILKKAMNKVVAEFN